MNCGGSWKFAPDSPVPPNRFPLTAVISAGLNPAAATVSEFEIGKLTGLLHSALPFALLEALEFNEGDAGPSDQTLTIQWQTLRQGAMEQARASLLDGKTLHDELRQRVARYIEPLFGGLQLRIDVWLCQLESRVSSLLPQSASWPQYDAIRTEVYAILRDLELAGVTEQTA